MTKYYIDSFESAFLQLWIEDIEDVFPQGADLASLKISGDSELHFLSHIEYVTSQGKSEESFLGSPDLDEIEIMESVDEELDEIIGILCEENNHDVEENYISEEFSDIYRCCVDYITLKALDSLVEQFSKLNINKTKNFQYGLYRHDDNSLTSLEDNNLIVKSYIEQNSFEKEMMKKIAEILFEDENNREWLMSKLL